MFRVLVKTQNTNHSCIAYNQEDLMISHELPIATIEELEENIASFRRSETNGFKAIPLKDVKTIKVREKHSEFFVQYQYEGRIKKYHFKIKDDQLRLNFCASLRSYIQLNQETVKQERMARIGVRLFLMMLITILTWFLSYVANNGVGTSSRVFANGASELLVWIGAEVIYAIGAGIVLFLIFKIIRTSIYPGKTFIYTKTA